MVASGAIAQDVTKKLYRWVDKDGKVHFDDALPPEAVGQARDEFNPNSGNKIGQVARALTPEERTKLAADQKAAAATAAAANQQQRMETVMLASYETESDLIRAYNERIGLLKSSLQSTDVSIRNMRKTLADLLARASETELGHRKVLSKRAAQIADLHSELVKQESFQVNRRTEYAALSEEFKRMLGRYRELRATTPAGSAPPVAPAPAIAPSATP
jgi:predicted RNase H-like nuclease (RuvC/YqgF family)